MFQTSLPMTHVWLSTAVRNGPVAAATTAPSDAASVANMPFMMGKKGIGPTLAVTLD
jgi:hypothetical protein